MLFTYPTYLGSQSQLCKHFLLSSYQVICVLCFTAPFYGRADKTQTLSLKRLFRVTDLYRLTH